MDSVGSRAVRALRAPHNWLQLARFCAVGASGYVVNLAVFAVCIKWAPAAWATASRRSPPSSSRWPTTSPGTGTGRSTAAAAGPTPRRRASSWSASARSRSRSRPRDPRRGDGRRRAARAGDRDRDGDAAELHRQQALVLSALT